MVDIKCEHGVSMPNWCGLCYGEKPTDYYSGGTTQVFEAVKSNIANAVEKVLNPRYDVLSSLYGAALTVWCPSCDAKAGEPCIPLGGTPYYRPSSTATRRAHPHDERVALARRLADETPSHWMAL